MPLCPAPITTPSYSNTFAIFCVPLNDLNVLNCLNVLNTSVGQIVPTVPAVQIVYGTSTLNLKLQVFFHDLPTIAPGSGDHGVRRMRGDPDLVESCNRGPIT